MNYPRIMICIMFPKQEAARREGGRGRSRDSSTSSGVCLTGTKYFVLLVFSTGLAGPKNRVAHCTNGAAPLHAHASVRCEGAFYSLLLLTMGPDGPDLSRFRLSGKQQNIQEDFNCSLIISSSDLRVFFTLIFNSLEEDCVL